MATNGDVVRRWMTEAWNEKTIENDDDYARYFGEDYVGFNSAGTVEEVGLDDIKSYVRALHETLGDLWVTVHEVIEAGDFVTCRFEFGGVHRRELLGVKACGRPVRSSGIFIVRMRDGLIRRVWQTWDRHGLLEQVRDYHEQAGDGAGP